jgi:catechol 2,3-dioxygenase-like lactoylglutathione lyase family enzyme
MNLEHANMTVRSVDEAVRFLKIAFPDAEIRGGGDIHGDPARGRWVHFGNDQFYVALQENGEHSRRQDTTYRHDGINHLGFVVTGLDEIISRLKVAGYQLTPVSALKEHPHRRRAYFFDGNDVEWELVEYLSEEVAERNDYTL